MGAGYLSITQSGCVVRIEAADKRLGVILATNALALANSEPTALSCHGVVEIFLYWETGNHSTRSRLNHTEGKALHDTVTLLVETRA